MLQSPSSNLKNKSYILFCVFQRIPVQQSSEIPHWSPQCAALCPIMRGWNFSVGWFVQDVTGHMSVLTTKWQPVNFGYNFPIPRPTHHSNNGNNQKGAYGKFMEGILLQVPTDRETTSLSANSCRLGEQKEQLTYRFALFYSSLCILSQIPFLLGLLI